MTLSYQLIDTGSAEKLENWGTHLIARPAAQAIWNPKLSSKEWRKATARFTRHPKNLWKGRNALPETWQIEIAGIQFQISPTDFGHLGAFPEQKMQWEWMSDMFSNAKRSLQVLNLFAHTGGTTLAAAKSGCQVCHVDAAAGINDWARENAALNNLSDAPIRWITDDVRKFLKREIKRDRKYDAIILDPPTFGRGKKGEIFKIETDLQDIMTDCKALLSDDPLFLLLTCHTLGWTPIVLHNLLQEYIKGGSIESGEMMIEAKDVSKSLPSGCFARWTA